MRKPVLPRIFLLALLYAGVFVLLVSVQFAKRGGFTRRVGDFVVSGQYRQQDENETPAPSNEYYLDGDVHVFFGGMDFAMAKGNGGRSFYVENTDGAKTEALPERMIMSDDSARFVFAGGTELEFYTHYAGGSPEMRISGVFPEDAAGVGLPFKPQRRTGIRDEGNGQFIAVFDGVNYSFGNSPMDAERTLLLVNAGFPVSYRAIPERKDFSPADFTIPQAETAEAYDASLTRWRDQNFSLWNRTISQRNDEDAVTAFAGEALVRGTYKAAVAAVPAEFLRGNARTYRSSVYLGRLDQAYRSLNSLDREKLARLSRLINDDSLEFLLEPRVFEYFAVRGHFNFVDAGADLVRTIDPSVLSLDIVPGILEGYTDWRRFRPNTENPFEPLADQACFVISESLARSGAAAGDADTFGNRVFVLDSGRGDTVFNLRLGKALVEYAESVQDESWAGVGRSLVLSALSMGDAAGLVKADYLSPQSETEGDTPGAVLTTANLYRALNPIDAYPRAVSIGANTNNIWAWTAAEEVSAVERANDLDISVTFPAGETHYMILRGVRPFSRIQLYNMDFRSDPQFERYDSSGWSYIAPEQTLILKMRHRTNVEHIRIIYREEPRPAAPARTEPAAGSASGTGNTNTNAAANASAERETPFVS